MHIYLTFVCKCIYNPTMPNEIRDKNIILRVSELEKETFEKAAKLAGIALSSWIRERLRRSSIEELENNKQSIPLFENERIK